jgi:hypothetical protein
MAQHSVKDFAILVAEEIEKLTSNEISETMQQFINDEVVDCMIDNCSVEYTATKILISYESR